MGRQLNQGQDSLRDFDDVVFERFDEMAEVVDQLVVELAATASDFKVG